MNTTLKTKTVKVVDSIDWNNLVESVYGRPYNLRQQIGCMHYDVLQIEVPDKYADQEERGYNDDIPEVPDGHYRGVKFKTWLERDPKKLLAGCKDYQKTPWYLEVFWHRNFYPNLGTLANDLHEKGHLPAGNYYIEIDW